MYHHRLLSVATETQQVQPTRIKFREKKVKTFTNVQITRTSAMKPYSVRTVLQ